MTDRRFRVLMGPALWPQYPIASHMLWERVPGAAAVAMHDKLPLRQ